MTPRFVLDESSWAAATGADMGVLSNAIEHLLERLDVARERNERVVRHADYYETDLGDGVKLYSALFETGCRVQPVQVAALDARACRPRLPRAALATGADCC